MKFFVIGLGSMGKRRIRNLLHINENDIIGFDINEERCKEVAERYKIKTFNNLNPGLDQNPDIMIISTPPDLHMKYAKIALKNKIHFFTEASVVRDEMVEIINELNGRSIIGLPSCTMRYHPIVKKIKEILADKKIGRVLAFTYHSGQYLPDWHPWEDYRKFYVSKRETGACREIVSFELVWLTSVFGKIKSVIGYKGKISSLDVDIDDIYESLLEFENGVRGMLIVDVITRTPIRKLTVLTEKSTIMADWYKKTIDYLIPRENWHSVNIDDGVREKEYLHGENMYEEEMELLIKSVNREIPQPYSFKEDLYILQVLEAIEKSSESGKRQNIS